jgi:putative membrane protein
MGFMVKLVLRVLATAAALLLIANNIPGLAISSFATALLVALLWGIVSLTIRPVLGILTLPINILTLGLFSFVLNAVLFWMLSFFVPGFVVSGFIPALEGSAILSVVVWVLHSIF